MKAWLVKHYGEPEEMAFEDVETPTPQAGQVLVRNHAAGLNFFDILQIQGKYQSKPSFPFTAGAEVAGIVEATAPDVQGISSGDRVVACPQEGGFAEYTIARAARTFPIPEGMDFTQAAGFPIVYQTSFFALRDRAKLQKDEWLLVHAGASGVGMAAVQIGRAFGARVIATAGSNEKLEFCRSQGADHVLKYRDEAWVDEVKRITGGVGADVIYDPVGGDVFDLSTKCIAPNGRLLVVGFAGGRIPSIAANRILLKNMAVVGVFWGRYVGENPAYLTAAHEALSSLYREEKIRPIVAQTYKLNQAPQALQALAERKVAGKVVLTMD